MITLEQVLKAYEYANSHPHKYLRGTTNWCAAVAHILNDQKPAAQRQGGPVAWRGLNAGGEVVTEWIDGQPPERMTDLCGNAASFDKIEHAYAEQPAPVAVVLPDAEILDRFPEINFGNYGQDEVEALQAWAFEAYEVIEKLNGLKPSQDKEGN